METVTPILHIDHLSKCYDKQNWGCQDVTLDCESGKIYAFIGANGAGKTTTLKCCSGIHKPTMGDCIINGHSITKDTINAKMDLAYVADDPVLYESLPAIDFLSFIAGCYKIPSDLFKERVDYYADLFKLKDVLTQPSRTYSHGMKQKLALTAALIHEPKLLLLDEPFVGLDPEASHLVKEEMRKVCERGGCVLYSTHVLDVAEKIADEVIIIKDGKIISTGTMEAVKGNQSLEEVFLELENGEQHDAI